MSLHGLLLSLPAGHPPSSASLFDAPSRPPPRKLSSSSSCTASLFDEPSRKRSAPDVKPLSATAKVPKLDEMSLRSSQTTAVTVDLFTAPRAAATVPAPQPRPLLPHETCFSTPRRVPSWAKAPSVSAGAFSRPALQFPLRAPLLVPLPARARRYVRRAWPHPDQPPNCVNGHGATCRRCRHCKRLRCWKCAGDKCPSLHFEDECTTCAPAMLLQDWENIIADAGLAAAAADSAADFRAMVKLGAGRAATVKSLCSHLTTIGNYSGSLGVVVLPTMPPSSFIVDFIGARILGRKTACPKGKPVAYKTVLKDVWALRAWRRYYMKLYNVFLPDTTETADVAEALRIAKDNCVTVDQRKWPAEEDDIYKFVMVRAPSLEFWECMQALIIIVSAYSLIRKTPCFHIAYDGPVVLTTPSCMSAHEVDRVEIDMHFSLNELRQLCLRIRAHDEKNMALTAKSSRWIGNEEIGGLKPASAIRDILLFLNMPKGKLFRRHRDSKTMISPSDWQHVLASYVTVTSMPRQHLGHNSFRRYFAMALHESGIAIDTIRTMGYWWSDAAREYLSSMRGLRIRAFNQAALALTSARSARLAAAAPAAGRPP